MNLEDDAKTHDYVGTLFKTAKRCNAGHVMSSMKDCEKWDGGSVFIIVAMKGADKFDIVQTLVESLGHDE